MKSRLEELALATFRACHCRDYARVDIRIDQRGDPYVLEINSMTSLGPGSSFTLAARHAGYSFESLMRRIVEVACERYPHMPAVGEPFFAKYDAQATWYDQLEPFSASDERFFIKPGE